MECHFIGVDHILQSTPHTMKGVMLMKRKQYVPYVLFILVPLAAGGLSSIFTSQGMPQYEQLAKPPLTPPGFVFPIAWGILYVLMGIGAAKVWASGSDARNHAIFLFSLQLILNFFWSVWFFGCQWYLFAFVWLLLLIAAIATMSRAFYKIAPIAGWLQLPYLLWCAFAAYLNVGIWLMNR